MTDIEFLAKCASDFTVLAGVDANEWKNFKKQSGLHRIGDVFSKFLQRDTDNLYALCSILEGKDSNTRNCRDCPLISYWQLFGECASKYSCHGVNPVTRISDKEK
jgi:hypothetical protein